MKKLLISLILWLSILDGFSTSSIRIPCDFSQLQAPHTGDTIDSILVQNSVIEPQALFPGSIKNEIIINRKGYSISYNCTFNIANWVAYELTAWETKSQVRRKNQFRPDPMLDSCLVKPEDYTRSGYDKGHLAPSADMCWSLQTMEESFYMTNIAPQKPRFNRGIWKRLEDQTRDWAVENKTVFVVTGPVLKSGLSVIGENSISVPETFFRVILDYTDPQMKGIAFIMSNQRLTGKVKDYAVSIDSVERLTGIDLFYSLPDEIETKLEKSLDVRAWLWKGRTLKQEEADLTDSIETSFL